MNQSELERAHHLAEQARRRVEYALDNGLPVMIRAGFEIKFQAGLQLGNVTRDKSESEEGPE